MGVTPPHITPSGKEGEAPEIKDMYVDVGARSREEMERMGIAVGSVAVLDRELAVLNGSVVTGKAFDDRVGVAVTLYALRQPKDVPVTLYAVAISIPTRYAHSLVELLDVRDAVNAATLLRHVIEKTPPQVIDKFLERRVK